MIDWIVSSSVLIVLVLVLRQVLKHRICKGWQYALWLVVLIRLLVPFQLGTSPLSVENVIVAVQQQAEPSRSETPVSPPSAETVPPAQEELAPAPVLPDASTAPQESPVSAAVLLQWIWFAGMGAVGVWLLITNGIFAFRLRLTREKKDTFCHRAVYVSNMLQTPCLSGLLCPAIYVTPQAIEDPTTYQHTLEHEYTHYRHGDLYWSLLRGAAVVLHWYNPLVWIAAVLSRRDAELCCDESTLRRLGEEQRLSYGKTLLQLTCETASPYALLSTATTMAGPFPVIKERVLALAKRVRPTVGAAVLLVVLVLFVGIFTLTGAAQPSAEAPQEPVSVATTRQPTPTETSSSAVATTITATVPSTTVTTVKTTTTAVPVTTTATASTTTVPTTQAVTPTTLPTTTQNRATFPTWTSGTRPKYTVPPYIIDYRTYQVTTTTTSPRSMYPIWIF